MVTKLLSFSSSYGALGALVGHHGIPLRVNFLLPLVFLSYLTIVRSLESIWLSFSNGFKIKTRTRETIEYFNAQSSHYHDREYTHSRKL